MRLNEIKLITIIVSIFIISLIWIPHIRSIINTNKDQFVSIGIIGNNNSIENYYLGNDTEIYFGTDNYWNISITNNMNYIEYLEIRVKILSYNDKLPDSTTLSSSSAKTIYNIPLFLAQGATTYKNFTWSIAKPNNISSIENNPVEISTIITINNSKYPLILTLPHAIENNYVYSRIVFELWAFDETTNNISFVINTPKKTCIWNQIFFKLNLEKIT
jgi:hypothetical protein